MVNHVPKFFAVLSWRNMVRKLDDVIHDAVMNALVETEGSAPKAAKLLGIGKSTIYRYMIKMDWSQYKTIRQAAVREKSKPKLRTLKTPRNRVEAKLATARCPRCEALLM